MALEIRCQTPARGVQSLSLLVRTTVAPAIQLPPRRPAIRHRPLSHPHQPTSTARELSQPTNRKANHMNNRFKPTIIEDIISGMVALILVLALSWMAARCWDQVNVGETHRIVEVQP